MMRKNAIPIALLFVALSVAWSFAVEVGSAGTPEITWDGEVEYAIPSSPVCDLCGEHYGYGAYHYFEIETDRGTYQVCLTQLVDFLDKHRVGQWEGDR